MNSYEFEKITGISVVDFSSMYNIPTGMVRDQLRTGHCRIPITNTYGSRHPLYLLWSQIKKRCTNKNDRDYSAYGGRGIRMCPRWFYSFDNFVDDIGERPEGMSIDRIDNDKGYSLDNFRWATKTEQVINRRISRHNTSGIEGVTWNVAKHKWVAQIIVNKKYMYLGAFDSKEEAEAMRILGEYYRSMEVSMDA